MRGRAVVAGVVGLLLVLAGAAYVVLFAPDSTPGVRGLAPSGVATTDSQGMIAPGPSKAAYSPNGAHLAVLSAQSLSLAVRGELQPVVKLGGGASTVVDFAWMPSSDRLLVVEGPSVRRLNVVDLKGEVVAAATLSEPLLVDEGFGVTVDSTNTKAVLTTVTRDAIGGLRHFDLTVVDLPTGKVTTKSTPDVDETRPFFVTDTTVVATVETGDAMRAEVIDIESGKRTPLGRASGAGSLAAGVLSDSDAPVFQVVGDPNVVNVLTANGVRRLKKLDEGQVVVAVHPTGATAVVRVVVDGTVRLKVVALDSLGR